MKIADIEFQRQPLFLAPMEDVTDPAFRILCKRFGADLVYTEFVSADALVRSVKRTEQKLTVLPDERPVAIQIYGRDVPTMVEAAKIVEQAKPDLLDLNFGCPVKKVAGKGAGSGMLRNIPQLLEITRQVVKAVHVPVTVKTRLGWDDNSKIIVDLAEALQDCGIRALTIHGRTRAQMYKGEADWTLIGEVKNNPRMHIPIIGNGDITTPELARQAFDRYGVDAVMVGRGAIGQPWIFGEMRHYLDTGELAPRKTYAQQAEIIKEYIDRSIAWTGNEHSGIVHSRRHLAATPLFKGIDHFRATRIALLQAETRDALFALIDNIPSQYNLTW